MQTTTFQHSHMQNGMLQREAYMISFRASSLQHIHEIRFILLLYKKKEYITHGESFPSI